MWLRKTKLLPGGAPGGLEWKTDQDVIEVPDDLGMELVAIPDAGFAEVAPPVAKDAKEAPSDGSSDAPTAPRKRAARKPAATEISE